MKVTKKILSVILVCAILLVPAMLTFASCDREQGQEIDNTKTQINLKYYAGGFGTTWIDEAISAFEAKYANYSFEKGKVGVQVMKDYQKASDTADLVKGSKNNIYITEGVNYYEFITKDVMLDIREAFAVADTLYVMDQGKLELCGTPENVYESKNPVVRALIDQGLSNL